MTRSTKTTKDPANENEAWRLVCSRERGERYYSTGEMAQRAGISARNVNAIIARFRLMRKAGVEIDTDDWWTARMAPMPAAPAPAAA